MNIAFAGTPEFAAQHLSGLLKQGVNICAVVSQPDKPGKRGKKLIPSPVKLVAEEHRIPLLQPEKFSAEDLAPYEPDLLIVVAYGQILRQDLLDTPTHGCINVHGSLLPRWRGAAPMQRAIEAGDSETGVCIMQMDAGLDTGPVFETLTTPIDPSDTCDDLSNRLIELGVRGLVNVIQQICEGEAKAVVQIEDGINYAKKIQKAEAEIDWNLSCEAIRNKIHAFNPDPICFSNLQTTLQNTDQNLRVKLHHVAEVFPNETGNPGEILDVRPEGVLIATGQGALIVDKIQLPFRKGSVLSGRDVLNARSDILYPGVKFN